MMKNAKTAALAAALTLLAANAYAGELTSFSMPDVVVYADAASAPDTTIDVHKVNIGAAKTVPELLRGAAGLQIQSRPNSGGNEDLTVKLRGHDSRHFTVLVDGVPQSMSGVMGGGYVNWNAIPLNLVEKIEIIKGAKSAAYGQTEGGVINIITKRDATGGQLELTAGSEGRRQYSFSYGANVGDLDFNVYANKSKQDAYLRNSDYDNEQEGLALRYKISETDKLKFNFDHQELRRGLVVQNTPNGKVPYDPSYPTTPNGDGFSSYGAPIGDGSYTKIMRNNFSIAWDNQRDGGSDTFIYWRNHEKQREYNVNPSGQLVFDRYNVTDKSSGFVYNGTAQVSDRHRLGYGMDYKRLRYGYGWYNYNTNNDKDKPNGGSLYPSQKVDTIGAYVEDNWRMDNRWLVNTGLRYDHMKGDKDAAQANNIGSMSESALSPKLNITLKNDDKTTTALSINRIWRAPSMAEFYWHYAGMGFAKNMPLSPEKGWGYEASLSHKFSDKFTSNASAFYQDISDYINFTHTRPFNAYNIDKAQLWGFELENTYKMNDASSIFVNYTNMHTSKDGVAAGDKIGLKGELDYRPRHTLAMGYQYDKDKWHARYDVTYTSSQKATMGFPATDSNKPYTVQEIGGYMVHNASSTYDISKNSSINLTLYNIFDKNYSEIYGYPMEGRVFTATFTQKF